MDGLNLSLIQIPFCLSIRSCHYTARGSTLNTSSWLSGTISSSEPNTGLQCEHQEAEKYATNDAFSYRFIC